MLVKNVYILYPPGYSGSYVNWAINISDNDLSIDTIKDPINHSTSTKFGGAGTTHHHMRVPTHQGYQQHVNWVLYNRPTKPKIYVINVLRAVEYVISEILNHDPTGIFIRIHDNHDSLINSYGFINGVTKWPTYFAAHAALFQKQLTFDPFNCATDQIARNFFVDYITSRSAPPVDFDVLAGRIQGQQDWYYQRNKHQPHEVNESTYITNHSIDNRVFELSCADVSSSKFLNTFKTIMEQSQVSDNFDLNYVNNFHQNYVNAQINLQWFDSIEQWQQSGRLDHYLSSHSAIEACLIREIFKSLSWPSDVLDWHSMTINEINSMYQHSLSA